MSQTFLIGVPPPEMAPPPPPPGQYVVLLQRRRLWMGVFSFIIALVIILIIIFFVSGCFGASARCSSGERIIVTTNNPNLQAQNRAVPINIANNVVKASAFANNKVIPQKLEDYISVKLPQSGAVEYGDNITEKYSDMKLVSTPTETSCSSACDAKDECKGIWYREGECYLLPDVPQISGPGMESEVNVYLKKKYRPVISDRVFLADISAKLINQEWWNFTSQVGGKVAVFNKGDINSAGKTHYLGGRQYEIINGGILTGVYSSRILTEKETRNALAGFYPPGVAIVVDKATADTYQLDLSRLGNKTVYVKYFSFTP